MNDLEAIAEIVTEAAIKAAKKVTEPIEERVASLGRTIEATQVMNTKAVEDAQQAVEDNRVVRGDLTQAHDQLQSTVFAYIQDNAKIFEGLLAKGKDHQQVLDSLPGFVKAELADIQKAYDASFVEVRKALLNLEEIYDFQAKVLEEERTERDAKLDEQIKALGELAETKIDEIRTESRGDPGPQGPPGPPGEVGNMQMPTPWAEKRLYKSGESVIHRGGTWYCADTTAEEPGLTPQWTLLANGIDVKGCYEENGIATIAYADGSRFQYRVQPRRMGVWKGDERYQSGDLVTYNYSQYRALVDGPTQVPGKKIPDGESPQWHTEVGRGQKGPRGLPGDPQDAAAIVYAMVQKDIAESTEKMADYLEQVAL